MKKEKIDKSRCAKLLLYPLEDNTHKLALEYIKQNFNYAYIEHNKDFDEDGNILKPHTHVVIYFQNARYPNAIADELNIESNYILPGDLVQSLTYLIHFYNPDKYQYSIDEVYGPLKDKLKKLISDSSLVSDDFFKILYDYIKNSKFIYIDDLTEFALSVDIPIYFIMRNCQYFDKLLYSHNEKLRRYLDKHK